MKIQADNSLLISQWRAAPKMSAMVQGAIDVMQEGIADALDDLEAQWDVEKASGVWLDFLGVRVGLTRPLAIAPNGGERFGFRGVDDVMSFDSAPFKGGLAGAERYPLPDEIFRKFIKARGILDVSKGSFDAFRRAVNVIDPLAKATDNRDMTITIKTGAEGASSKWDGTEFIPMKDVEFADSIGALPRTAGISIIYQDGPRFGFRGAGEPFDTTRMR